MGESALHIEKRQYNPALPLWCVVNGDRVILCRETEAEARKEAEAMRGKP